MDYSFWLPTVLGIIHWGVVIALGLRIVRKRRPAGVSLAWLVVIATAPYVGAALYLLVGELWLSGSRVERAEAFIERARRRLTRLGEWLDDGTESPHTPSGALQRLGWSTGFMPTIRGNSVELLDGADAVFPRLLEDIEAATRSCDLLFYIWSPGGRVNLVAEALARAAQRGVRCRVLVDSAAGEPLLKHPQAEALREMGVKVHGALPVHWLRALAHRIDLRNHRKLVVIDDSIAYTGSLNMADPTLFNAHEGVGQWVDLMSRVCGPCVAALAAAFEMDWTLETEKDPELDPEPPFVPEPTGESPVQIVPSGPGLHPHTLHRMLLQAVHGAERELVISTPYFIPDEAMVSALVSGAQRGVRTTLIVPEKIDSVLVRHASRAYFDDLLDVGVDIQLYRSGLLHAKTVVIDREIAMLGTVNMDRRSFWINFELSLFIYDPAVASSLREIQARYIGESVSVIDTDWPRRSSVRRITENTLQLLAPLL